VSKVTCTFVCSRDVDAPIWRTVLVVRAGETK